MKRKMLNGCPLYKVVLADGSCRMLRVSFVDNPAVESDFVKYSETAPQQNYAVVDNDRRRVFGVVLRADYPIYREAADGTQFYVVFQADQIRAFAQKYLAEGRQGEVDLNHDLVSIEGAEMVQYFIKDSVKGINPAGFEGIADGSLFAEYQITDNALWERIKSGEFNGFSVEIIQGIEAIPEKNYNSNNMSKMTKIKEMLAKVVSTLDELQEYGAVATDRGSVLWDGDEDLKEGAKVFGEDADGNRIDLEDGDYRTEDQKVIVVAGGEVKEIKDKEAEVAPADAPVAEPESMEGEEEPAPAAEPEPDEKDKRIADLEAENEGLKEQIEELKEKLLAPAGEPAHEAFKKCKKSGAYEGNPFDAIKVYIKK